jgi:predicted transposase YdaD
MISSSLKKGHAEGLAEGEAIGLQKGLAEGETIGLEKGEAIGLQKGIEKGREEGKAEAMREIALTAHRNGHPVAHIQTITGLTEEEIAAILG